ncbi:hypothetical protein [Xanthomonas sp. XNM01]|uniref:hypothetical protein n=1 Tax=Xanthomonas sp. XNM01 TaxID=2769289 RepID=UPI00177D71C2|nr:hypothetical protein [Xanthomonas sp. XNM01]MBD9367360.1 hypothetical protein [Xanthomonas sp. XNM01]
MTAAISMTGCQGMATTTQDPAAGRSRPADNTVADWPLKFVQHNFGAFCYSTYGCTIRYGGYSRSEPDDELQISSESIGAKYPGNLDAGYLGILEFPPPATVRWRSRDGVQHEAEVDIGTIFKDRLILHRVPREDIPEGVSILNPGIVLEVNDRTINVYMRAFIPTKEPQIPGNPHSSHRDDLILAWSQTY